MRIEILRFANINSLKGTWEVDFSDPALRDSGLFLITGPTGSGKTTLLDAVCIALYGRTPRLPTLSANSNEAMSRQATECFSEVEFTTDEGRFRVRWSQGMSRRRNPPVLVQPRWEFQRCGDQESLVTGIRTVQSQVEEATGMTYDQFTRSVLLAQGDFARFLQSKAVDRSGILEAITGTEIYSRISREVFERSKKEDILLNEIRARMEGISLLSPEEVQDLRSRRQEVSAELAQAGRAFEQASEHLTWMKNRTDLLASQAEARAEETRLAEKAAEMDRERRRLADDDRARSLDAASAAVGAARNESRRLEGQIRESRSAIPPAEDAARQADEALQTAQSAREDARRAQEEQAPLLREVRDLDSRIAPAREEWDRARKDLAKMEQSHAERQAEARDLESQYALGEKALEALEQQLADTARDAALAGEGLLLEARLRTQAERRTRAAGLEKSLEKAVAAENAARSGLTKAEKAAQAAGDALQKAGDRENDLARSQEALLGGASVSALRGLIQALRAQDGALAEFLTGADELDRALQALASARQDAAEQEGEMARLKGLLPAAREKLDLAGRLVSACEDRLLREQAILGLEEHRKKLREGQPCPCCGSTVHPWAEAVPETGQAETALAEAREREKACRGDLDALNAGLVRAEGLHRRALADTVSREEECGRRRAVLDERLQAALAAKETLASAAEAELPDRTGLLALVARLGDLPGPEGETPSPDQTEGLRSLRPELESLATDFEQKLAECEDLEKKLKELRVVLTDLSRQAAEADGGKESSRAALDHARADREKASGDLDAARAEIAAAREELVRDLAPYGLAPESADDEASADLLAGRRKARADLEDQARKTREEHQNLGVRISTLRAGLEGSAGALKKLGEDVSARRGTLDDLEKQRKDLFGEKDPGAWEKTLDQALKKAEEEERGAATQKENAHKALAAARAAVRQAEEALADAERRREDQEKDFLSALSAQGFDGEEALARARLNDEDRQGIQKALEDLAERRAAVQGQLETLADSLKALAEKDFEDAPLEELSRRRDERAAARDSLQAELGGMDQRLRTDARERERLAGEEEKRRVQEEVSLRWKELSRLIGSSDGQKFRNFAQELTFGRLIAHANRELAKLTRRYLLIRDTETALEFKVVDQYQGNEIRSIRNLSGGETFLASLALALGLSALIRGRTRIETLFLDEGFGTLDPEALDAAIQTLNGLSGGDTASLVGIISHVEALREKVDTKLLLTRGSDGFSSLSGPGCRKL